LAETDENLSEPMIFFLDRGAGGTRIIRGDPSGFVGELARRWREQFRTPSSPEDLRARMPDEMLPNAVFISYATEDGNAAWRLASDLTTAGVPVWLDKQRLKVGENFERDLGQAVKDGCSFFISLISAATEADAGRYCHKERAWAANRHTDGWVFYLPVIIDGTANPQREPPCFAKTHLYRLPDGRITPEFADRLRKLVDAYRCSGRPRG
jgi:hypothetical protein